MYIFYLHYYWSSANVSFYFILYRFVFVYNNSWFEILCLSYKLAAQLLKYTKNTMIETQKSEAHTLIDLLSNTTNKQSHIQSLNEHLNKFFGGGLQPGMVTQLYGESGSGKTQTAMLFALGAMERSLTVGFLSAGKDLHFGRFTQLAYSAMNESQYQERENYLLFKKTNEFGSAMQFIQQIMSQIRQTQRGGLLIIDSVYTLMNSCFEHFGIESDNLQKSRKQADFVNRVRWMAKVSKAAVLMINQASDNVDGRRSFGFNCSLVPALGPSWDLNMDESIELCKKGQVREFKIVNSPKCRSGDSFKFRITSEGFIAISEEGVQYD